ncbi:MAG: UDP-glucose 4-epimerase GalE [Gammaproteobacteria bacterium]|nr:UDP-glucose 4-epimerase GalE [Gammaproteobacteria bacterium]
MAVILVTGGAGYIGSHTCKALAAMGHEPVVYDNLTRGHADAVKWGPLIQGDIRDYDSIHNALIKHRPEAVLHFAAYAYVGESVSSPGKYYRNNVAGAITTLNAMQAAAVNKFVFSSTCSTYGTPETNPIGDGHPQNPINPYGRSKLMVEQILRDFATAFGLRSCALRYFNAAGADPDTEIGERHDPEPHLIPNVLLTALGRREKVTVHGDDYDTPDGTCIRDYIHVMDLADAHILALDVLERRDGFQFYNLGNEVGYSVLEIIAQAREICDRDIPVETGPRRAGDPAVLVADSERAREALGWVPKLAALEDIIGTAWQWYRRANVA